MFLWIWATHFNDEAAMVALNLSARTKYNFSVPYDLCQPSTKHLNPSFLFLNFFSQISWLRQNKFEKPRNISTHRNKQVNFVQSIQKEFGLLLYRVLFSKIDCRHVFFQPKLLEELETFTTQLVILQLYYLWILPQSTVHWMTEVQINTSAFGVVFILQKIFRTAKILVSKRILLRISSVYLMLMFSDVHHLPRSNFRFCLDPVSNLIKFRYAPIKSLSLLFGRSRLTYFFFWMTTFLA